MNNPVIYSVAMVRATLAGVLFCSLLRAQIPDHDARNQDVPNTNTHFRMPEYRTLAEWEERKAHLRKQILFAAGLLPMPEKTPLNPRIVDRVDRGDYSVETVLLETRPGYFLGGNLYRPAGRTGRFPGIASPHGHWTYGRLENTDLGSIPARCINLARQGYVVFAYDMVGYNDTIQTPHAFGGPREQLWSFGPLGLQLWNSIRVVDFLQSLPDVDPERIAATGASGGGTQTFLLTAVDERVKWSAPVNMISAIMQGGSPCENAPGLRIGAFNVEFGAMMAPRPLLMVSATGDWTRNTPNEEFPAIQSIYKLYGKPENVETIQIQAPHNYNRQSREAVYRFFGQRILADADAGRFVEKGFHVEPLPRVLALHNRPLPDNALKYEQIFDQWVREAKRQNDAVSDAAQLRERLTLALAAEWPAEVVTQTESGGILLGRPGRGDRIPAKWKPGKGPGTLIVNPEGSAAAASTMLEAAKGGGSVLAIDAYQTGSAVAPRAKFDRHYLTFNRSDDANRVQDIVTALAFLKRSGASEIRLAGTGKAAVWCLFAAAIAPVRVTLNADLSGFGGSDQEFTEQFFVPGIQRAGGLTAAKRLTNSR